MIDYSIFKLRNGLTFDEFLIQQKQILQKERKFITRKGIDKLKEVWNNC